MNAISPRQGIIAGGNFIVDQVKLVDSWPPEDALANILEQSSENGGSPYNILKNLAKLGATFPREAVGLVGNDMNGRFIREDCLRHGVDLQQLRTVAGIATSYTDVMTVRGTGRRTFFHQRGANALLAPDHFDFSATGARHFHLGYALLLDTLDSPEADGVPASIRVLQNARAAGMTVSLDCVSENSDRFKSVVAPMLPFIDVLLANDFESEKITGIKLRHGAKLQPKAVAEAALALLRLGVRKLVIVHFPEGICAASADGLISWQGSVRLPQEAIVGAAGAGDALAAGILFGWHEGWPLASALELGVCVAAASLRQASCSGAIETLDRCLGLGNVHGFLPLGIPIA